MPPLSKNEAFPRCFHDSSQAGLSFSRARGVGPMGIPTKELMQIGFTCYPLFPLFY